MNQGAATGYLAGRPGELGRGLTGFVEELGPQGWQETVVVVQVKLSEATLNQNRDYPVLTDYRALIGGLAGRLYGLGPTRLSAVFPGASASDMGLL